MLKGCTEEKPFWRMSSSIAAIFDSIVLSNVSIIELQRYTLLLNYDTEKLKKLQEEGKYAVTLIRQ